MAEILGFSVELVESVSVAQGGNVSLSVTVEGGTEPYSYVWKFGTETLESTTNTLSVPATTSGVYSVEVTDGDGATITSSSTVTVIPTFKITTPVASTLTVGEGKNINLSVAASGGVTPYTYVWKLGSTTLSSTTNTLSVPATTSGTVTVTITDGEGTVLTSSSTVTVIPTFKITTPVASTLTVGEGKNINLSVAASGGVTPYTYVWKLGSTTLSSTTNTLSVPATTSGTVTVTITDGEGTVLTSSSTVTVIPTFKITTPVASTLTVGEGKNINLSVAASGGVTPYTYVWKLGSTTLSSTTNTLSVPATTSGTVTVTITDGEGTVLTSSSTVTVIPTFKITTPLTPIVNILSGKTINLSVAASGGVTPYTYVWKLGSTTLSSTTNTLSVPATTSGTVTVTITDGEGTVLTSSSAVNILPAFQIANKLPATLTATENEIVDFGIIATGGTTPYTYVWKFGSTTLSSTTNTLALPATESGTVSVTVTDKDNVVLSSSTVLTVIPELYFDYELETQFVEEDTEVTMEVTVVGGLEPYTYSWSNSNGTIGTNNPILVFQSTTNTVINVEVTDARGTSIISSANVQVYPIPTLMFDSEIEDSIIERGTELVMTMLGYGGRAPYTYSWSNSTGVIGTNSELRFIPNETMEITGTITDSKGKTARNIVTVTVIEPETPPIDPEDSEIPTRVYEIIALEFNFSHIRESQILQGDLTPEKIRNFYTEWLKLQACTTSEHYEFERLMRPKQPE